MSRPTSDPTLLGTVEDVTGPRVSVKLADETAHGLMFVRGEGYRVGQVGSFVRIPVGYVDLYGIVAQVGAGASPKQPESLNHNSGGVPWPPDAVPQIGSRWLRVELIGEGRRGEKFERGISQYPSIGDAVHVVTESDLSAVYAPGDIESHVAIGRVASAEGIRAYIDLNKLVSRHSAVVGSTGAGKSTAVASLLTAVSDVTRFPAARVILLDLHGEYAKALADRASVLRLTPRSNTNERQLYVPFWALGFDELVSVCFGKLDDKQKSVIADLILTLKREAAKDLTTLGIDVADITIDTPVPFSLRQLWFRQHCREYRMVMKKQGGSEEEVTDALVLDGAGNPEQLGDAETLTPRKFRTSKTTGPKDQFVSNANEGANLRQQLAGLQAKLRDDRLGFLFSPGGWEPNPMGQSTNGLELLLAQWFCSEHPITVFDLSGMPATILDDLVGSLLRILFDAVFWGKHLPQGGRQRPLLLVLEEAHVYLSSKSRENQDASSGRAASAARRIAKEGRKYGVGLMLVSQRPSEIDGTILSQCGTMVALRLTNETDRGQIRACSSDNLEGLFAMLPILRTGEALIVGEAVSMPVRALIDLPPWDRRPESDDPLVVVPRGKGGKRLRPGGWTEKLGDENYKPVVEAWRNQNPHPAEAKAGHLVKVETPDTKEKK